MLNITNYDSIFLILLHLIDNFKGNIERTMNEVKHENFKRIAENRSNKILGYIRSFENFKNTSYYEYTDEEIDLIFDTIQDELNDVKEQLKNSKDNKRVIKL